MTGELFAIDEKWIWAILALQTVLMIWFTERGELFAALVVLSTAAGSLFYLSHFVSDSFWTTCQENLWAIPGVIGAYLVIGLAWAVFKWWEYAHKIRSNYERIRAKWLLPGNLRRTAIQMRDVAKHAATPNEKKQLLASAEACWRAAALGGRVMTNELKPLWKEHVQNDFATY